VCTNFKAFITTEAAAPTYIDLTPFFTWLCCVLFWQFQLQDHLGVWTNVCTFLFLYPLVGTALASGLLSVSGTMPVV